MEKNWQGLQNIMLYHATADSLAYIGEDSSLDLFFDEFLSVTDPIKITSSITCLIKGEFILSRLICLLIKSLSSLLSYSNIAIKNSLACSASVPGASYMLVVVINYSPKNHHQKQYYYYMG
jgi:hypothetical protein